MPFIAEAWVAAALITTTLFVVACMAAVGAL